MRRFLHVIHYPVFGGPTNQALRLAAPLRERGWDTLVLLPDEPGNAAERLRAGGVEVVQLPLHRLRANPDPRVQAQFAIGFVPEVRAIRRLIRERSIDLVLLTGLTNPHAAFAARAERVPLVWQLVDTRPPMALRRALMPLVRWTGAALMSTGLEVARVHPGAMSFGERLVPFFPPVDVDAFATVAGHREAARAELDIAPDAVAVCAIGNLNPQKGHGYLLRAAALARRTVPGLEVRILGAPQATQASYEARLREFAARLGLDPARVFVDPGSRIPELLPAFDVLALTSVPRSEGIPTVILEAMAAGLPVVSTDVGGVREAIHDGETGTVVAPGDVRAITTELARLARTPGLAAAMGARGREVARASFGTDRCAEAHLRALEIGMRNE